MVFQQKIDSSDSNLGSRGELPRSFAAPGALKSNRVALTGPLDASLSAISRLCRAIK